MQIFQNVDRKVTAYIGVSKSEYVRVYGWKVGRLGKSIIGINCKYFEGDKMHPMFSNSLISYSVLFFLPKLLYIRRKEFFKEYCEVKFNSKGCF